MTVAPADMAVHNHVYHDLTGTLPWEYPGQGYTKKIIVINGEKV